MMTRALSMTLGALALSLVGGCKQAEPAAPAPAPVAAAPAVAAAPTPAPAAPPAVDAAKLVEEAKAAITDGNVDKVAEELAAELEKELAAAE